MAGVMMHSEFNPLNVSGCALWLEAGRGVVLDGSSNVSQEADFSGNVHTVSQGTALNRPGYSTNAIGGRPGLIGTGSAICLGANNIYASTITKATMISVAKLAVIDSNDKYGITYKSPQSGVAFSWDAQGNYLWCYAGDASQHYARAGFTSTSPFILVQEYDGTQSTNDTKIKVYINGSQQTCYFPAVTIATSISSFSQLVVMANSLGAGGLAPLNGALSEHLLYLKTPTTAERQYLERGLGAKYGIAVA